MDIAAPGAEILSTLPGGLYGLSSGTSMATPHVSGVAALLLGFAPGMGAVPLRQRILEHAEPIAALAGKVVVGGRVNAFRCLLDADITPPGPIADLRVQEPLSDGLVLSWTDTGDDGDVGAAAGYDLRLSEAPFDASGFDAAPRFPVPGLPFAAGSPRTQEIGGLAPSRTWYLGLRAVDEWGNPGPPAFASVSTRPAPAMQVAPQGFSASLLSGQLQTLPLTLRNTSEGTLDWSLPRPVLRPAPLPATVGLERWGGPDDSGYTFIDSDEPGGPVFAWRDIGATGRSALIAGDDEISEPIPLGFPFTFYGETFTSVRIAGNGFLTFTHDAAPFINQPLPSPGAPGNLVAAFWDDLLIWSLQDVVWLAEPHTFTVQYTGVLHIGPDSGGPYTFQIILDDSGAILFQYLEMATPIDTGTIGIQNGSGTAGLQVAFDAPYLHDRLAVRLALQDEWVRAVPRSGRLRPGESATVALTLDASGLIPGTYVGSVPVLSNAPDQPRVELPVSLAVADGRGISVEPAKVDFGDVFALYGGRLGVDIVSSGSLPLMVTSVVPDNPTVTVHFTPVRLAPGERRLIDLEWHPAAPGGLMGSLRIESDAANAPSLVVPLLGVALNIPPLAFPNWPPSQVECAGPSGSEVVLDGSLSSDEDPPVGVPGIVLYEWIEDLGGAGESLLGTGSRLTATLPLGAHRVALRVTDGRGGTGSAEKTITIVDTLPPEMSVIASPPRLWPPNHRMVPVSLSMVGRDTCSGNVEVRLMETLSSEPDDAPGVRDGRSTGDVLVAEPGTAVPGLVLRAERDVAGPGRVYTLRHVATDPSGNTAHGETIVPVSGGDRKARIDPAPRSARRN